jgi:hypothetical protein
VSAFDAHRAARDALAALLGPGAPGPAAAYDVTVATAVQARTLAAAIEDDLAGRWHDLLAYAELRARAVQGLSDSAVRAALWRRAAGPLPWTTPFPGQDLHPAGPAAGATGVPTPQG